MDGGVAGAAAVKHNAHALRTPKHEGRNRNGRRRLLVLQLAVDELTFTPEASQAPRHCRAFRVEEAVFGARARVSFKRFAKCGTG
jgi:hypothetical protein